MKTVKIILIALAVAAMGIFASCKKEDKGSKPAEKITYSVTKLEATGALEEKKAQISSELNAICSKYNSLSDRDNIGKECDDVCNKYIMEVAKLNYSLIVEVTYPRDGQTCVCFMKNSKHESK